MALFKRLVTLTTGTAGGQLILLLSTPILARLYSPQDFGYFATSTGLAMIFSAVAYFRYDAALLIHDKKSDPAALLHLSIFLLLFTGLLFYIALYISQNSKFYASIVPGELGILKMVLLFLMLSLSGLLTTWHARYNRFSVISSSKIILASAVAGFQYIGYSKYGGIGLILGNISGLVLVNIFLIYFVISNDSKVVMIKPNLSNIKKGMIVHKSFPIYSVFSTLLNGLSNQLPSMLFARAFGASYAGYYSMSSRFTRGPVSLIGQSVSHVVSAHVGINATDIDEIRKTIVTILSKMTHFAGPLLIMSIFFVEKFFSFVLGEGWETAGILAMIFLPWIYALYLSWPVTCVFNTLGRQNLVLVFNFLFIVAIALPFIFVNWIGQQGVVYLMMFLGSLFRFAYIVSALRLIEASVRRNLIPSIVYWAISVITVLLIS